MDFSVIIPARYASSRLPAKLLEDINGKSLIERTYLNALQSSAKRVIIATDDERINTIAKDFNAPNIFSEYFNKKNEDNQKRIKSENRRVNQLTKNYNKTESGLYYKIISKGKGGLPVKGKSVSVHYKGMLLDSTIFDSSYSRNQPIEFTLGFGQVIPGWDEGISLLKKGSKATLIIPPNLAYGSAGAGGVIPPNSTLIFEVELINFK